MSAKNTQAQQMLVLLNILSLRFSLIPYSLYKITYKNLSLKMLSEAGIRFTEVKDRETENYC